MEAKLYADGRTAGQTETHIAKLIVAFHTFANAPKNGHSA